MGDGKDLVRKEWRIKIRTSLGTIRTEWRTSEEAAEALRDKYDVVSIELTDHKLDY
jgi:hypothetical protein